MMNKTFLKLKMSSLQNVAFLAFSLIFTAPVFSQEVSLKSLKSNALYVGVENLVQVTVPGVPSEKIFIGSDGIDIQKMEDGVFKLGIKYPGKLTLLVHGEGFKYKTFDFDVVRLPDPLAALQLENGTVLTKDEITAADFKSAVGVGFETGGYNGDLSIGIASFSLVKVSKDEDPAEVPVNSSKFNNRAKSLVNSAKSGDTFYFERIMANVEGTTDQRQMNSLVFHIK